MWVTCQSRKAEQYLRDTMARYRTKITYDQATGEIRDNKKFMSMLEDYWLPRREGGRGTEVSTLPGGQNLGELSDLKVFPGQTVSCFEYSVLKTGQEGAGLPDWQVR